MFWGGCWPARGFLPRQASSFVAFFALIQYQALYTMAMVMLSVFLMEHTILATCRWSMLRVFHVTAVLCLFLWQVEGRCHLEPSNPKSKVRWPEISHQFSFLWKRAQLTFNYQKKQAVVRRALALYSQAFKTTAPVRFSCEAECMEALLKSHSTSCVQRPSCLFLYCTSAGGTSALKSAFPLSAMGLIYWQSHKHLGFCLLS